MLDYDVKKMYEDMEIHLIKSMKRNYKRHLIEENETGFEFPQWQAMKLKELKRYQRQNKDIIQSDVKGLTKNVSSYLKEELKQGSLNVIAQNKIAMGDSFKESKSLNKSFFKSNDKKINALIESVNNDLSDANKAILRKTNDQYRKVIFQSQMYVANGVLTPQQAIDRANQEFLRAGLNVIEYKDGRRVNIASYSQMAIRTAGQRATLMGEGTVRKKYGQHLVRVSTHGTSCPVCKVWQNKILIDDVYSGGSKEDGDYTLLSEAMEQGFLHPNCRHGLTTYFPDIEAINKSYENGKSGKESDDKYQDDLNYINLKIKEYNRLEKGSIDEENTKQYKTKRKEWTEKAKELEEDKLEAVHITSLDNAISIFKEGFRKDKMRAGIFGKGVYASNDSNVNLYYKDALDDGFEVSLTYNTKNYADLKLVGLQETEENLYNNLIVQFSEEIQEEYKKLLNNTQKQDEDFRRIFLKVIKQHGYKGMIIHQDMSMIDDKFYQAHKFMIDKVNDEYIDILVGGSQIVGWDLSTIQINR